MVLIVGKSKISGSSSDFVDRSLRSVFGVSISQSRYFLATVGLDSNATFNTFASSLPNVHRELCSVYRHGRAVSLSNLFKFSYSPLIGKDLKRALAVSRSRFLEIGSYSANRMKVRLPVHGQRTRSNRRSARRKGSQF